MTLAQHYSKPNSTHVSVILPGVKLGSDGNSVGSYVIPWEYHVNSCHLRFSCSELYVDLKNRVSFF